MKEIDIRQPGKKQLTLNADYDDQYSPPKIQSTRKSSKSPGPLSKKNIDEIL